MYIDERYKFSDLYIKYYIRFVIKPIKSYDYDLFVIGGGSGGIAASKEAATYGVRVGLADFVKPTPRGTKWGLGGTCVNVGCIPEKMMHYAGIMYENINEYESLGYPNSIPKKHEWEILKNNVQTYIKYLNFGYKTSLKKNKIIYYNKLARLIDNHTIELTGDKFDKEIITADKIIIAVGGRPKYLDIEGARELCITSDDIFSLNKAPGKTLIVGGSYIALVDFF